MAEDVDSLFRALGQEELGGKSKKGLVIIWLIDLVKMTIGEKLYKGLMGHSYESAFLTKVDLFNNAVQDWINAEGKISEVQSKKADAHADYRVSTVRSQVRPHHSRGKRVERPGRGGGKALP